MRTLPHLIAFLRLARRFLPIVLAGAIVSEPYIAQAARSPKTLQAIRPGTSDGATSKAPAAREDDELARLRQDAERGDPRAQFRLGVQYATGTGVTEDDAVAAEWIRKAADQGLIDAEFNLGLMYADGNGVPQDSAQAVAWLRKAANKGDARAQSNLGLMYANSS